MNITWALFKVEAIKLIKTPIIIIFGIAAPVFFMIMQSTMFKNNVDFVNQKVSMLDMSLPMCALMSIAVLGIGNVGVGLSHTRTVNYLKRLKATPAKKHNFITANLMLQFIVMALTIAVLCAIAVFKFDVDLKNHNIPQFLLVLLISFMMCYFIGMFIGSVCEDPRSSQSVSMFVYFLCIFLGGFTMPIELMPNILQKICYLIPTTHAVKIIQYAWNNVSIFTSYHFWVVTAITVVFGALTLKFFRYE